MLHLGSGFAWSLPLLLLKSENGVDAVMVCVTFALEPVVENPRLALFPGVLDRDYVPMTNNKVAFEENKVLVRVVVIPYLVIPESQSKLVLHWTFP